MEPLKVSQEEYGSESSLIRSSYKVKYASLSETKTKAISLPILPRRRILHHNNIIIESSILS